jgi:hypothetical protein
MRNEPRVVLQVIHRRGSPAGARAAASPLQRSTAALDALQHWWSAANATWQGGCPGPACGQSIWWQQALGLEAVLNLVDRSAEQRNATLAKYGYIIDAVPARGSRTRSSPAGARAACRPEGRLSRRLSSCSCGHSTA